VNIALIIHELISEGGGERQMISLARALQQRGHQVTVYASEYDSYHCFPESCTDLKVIETGRGALSWVRRPRGLRGYLDMKRMARAVRERHEIWNPHHWPAEWGAIRLRTKLSGRVVWTCNDVPNLHEIAVHPRNPGERLRSPLNWLYYLWDRRQNGKVDLTVFLSRWAEEQFKKIYPGATRVVRSGADPVRFSPGGDRDKIRARFGYSEDEFVLLWLGILMPHRRLQDVIAALPHLKESAMPVRLLLAGSAAANPGYMAELRALVHQLGIEQQVTFSGKVPDEEIRDFYCACDAFVFPNEAQTWGLAVLEAMSCGVPVLVSTGAAVHEILTDGENALLFPARTPQALASAVEKLIRQPELRASIAGRGRELVRTTYNWDTYAASMEQVFASVRR